MIYIVIYLAYVGLSVFFETQWQKLTCSKDIRTSRYNMWASIYVFGGLVLFLFIIPVKKYRRIEYEKFRLYSITNPDESYATRYTYNMLTEEQRSGLLRKEKLKRLMKTNEKRRFYRVSI